MHIRLKRSLGLILLAGLLLLALLQGWTPQSSSTVDIKPRRGSNLKELIDRKIHDIVGSYGDIPYHTKESVARCAARERFSPTCHFSLNSHINFTHLISLPDAVC